LAMIKSGAMGALKAQPILSFCKKVSKELGSLGSKPASLKASLLATSHALFPPLMPSSNEKEIESLRGQCLAHLKPGLSLPSAAAIAQMPASEDGSEVLALMFLEQFLSGRSYVESAQALQKADRNKLGLLQHVLHSMHQTGYVVHERSARLQSAARLFNTDLILVRHPHLEGSVRGSFLLVFSSKKEKSHPIYAVVDLGNQAVQLFDPRMGAFRIQQDLGPWLKSMEDSHTLEVYRASLTKS
ncbi:MAG: hypothetical protein KDK78_04390, partial [Chlamydiia bacterium]|nr:hypothetical protein [Chlamydiia bacterium]